MSRASGALVTTPDAGSCTISITGPLSYVDIGCAMPDAGVRFRSFGFF